MDDAPWMPPGSNEPTPGAGAQQPSVPTPPPAPAPVNQPPGNAAPGDSPWSRSGPGSGNETVVVPRLPQASPPPPPASPPPPAAPFAAPGAPVPPSAVPSGDALPASAGGSPSPFDPTPTPKRSRSKVLVGAAVVGVLAVGAAGVFAVRSFTGGSAQGGAATPEELGTALMTAIENEDVLGMIDVLSPGERDVFRQPMIDLVSELTRLEVLAPEADLGKIDGFDIVLENERVAPQSTNVADIVNIRMTADATVSVDGAAVPVGALVTDNMDQEMVDELRGTTETTEEDFDGTLTAVELDGRWYFSLFFTLAETLRDDASFDEELLIPQVGLDPLGADSPEAAVNQMLDSVERLDLRLLMQTLNPGEAAALQRYSPLFLDDVDAALEDVPLTWRITTRDFRVEGDGDTRTAFIDAIAIEGDLDGETFTVSVDGDCVTASAAGETFEQCAGEAIADEQIDEFLAEIPEVKEFVDALSETFADVEPIGLELRRFDGEWYVSPISTMSEAVLKVLRALDRAEIDRLIELGTGAFDQGMDEVMGGFGDDVILDDDLFDDSFGSFESFDTSFDTVPASGSDACYAETDATVAAACFQGFIDSGEIDPFIVPIELRFPECGYFARWTGDLYSMDDATFIATVESVRPCFLALVDSGQIESYELPSEINYLECFEGRNWYNTFGDAEYDERYYACIDAAIAGG